MSAADDVTRGLHTESRASIDANQALHLLLHQNDMFQAISKLDLNRTGSSISRIATISCMPFMHFCMFALLQILATGNCIDGSACGPGKTYSYCKATATQGRSYSNDDAVASPQFSTAYKVFAPGTYTVLLRTNDYMGCGGGTSDCVSWAPIAFKAETGGCGLNVALWVGWCCIPGSQ